MTARYGRNKRRADRERIANLHFALITAEAQLSSERRHHAHTRHQLYNAREIALTEAVNKDDKIKFAMGVIADELARMLGKEAAPIVLRILASDPRHPRQPIWDVRVSDIMQETIVRCRIELDYNIVLERFR